MKGLSPEELSDIYERYAPVVFRRARALLGREADAWDVVQEVFRKLLEQGGQFRGEARPMTYIYRVTTNLALNTLRARVLRESSEAAPPPEEESTASPQEVEARSLLRTLARELDERGLRIAALHFVDGLTQDEVAEIVGLSRKTVGKELAAIRARADRLTRGPEEGHG